MKNITLLYFLAIGLWTLSACQSKINLDTKENSAPSEIEANVDLEPETIAPKEVFLLLPSQYREESTGYPQNVGTKDRFELYRDEDSGHWLIGKADLIISYGRDECVGEDVMIIKSKHEGAVLFFTAFEGLVLGELNTILENKSIFPDRPLDFEFNGTEYSLLPRGSVQDDDGIILLSEDIQNLDEEELDYTYITSYRLSFGSDAIAPYPLAAIEAIQSKAPKVVWAGDINQDGLPDMVLDLSDFYESSHLFLFLSDKNDEERPLKKAADLKVVNDC